MKKILNVATAPKTGTFQMRINPQIKELLREQAVSILMKELKKGEDSVRTEADWIAEDEILSEFGIEL